MKRNLIFAIILIGVLVLTARPVVAQDTPMTANEAFIMRWVDASVNPDTAQTAAKAMFAPDFVFYGAGDDLPLDAAAFVQMDAGKGFLPLAMNCVVKGEHDLVQVTYLRVTSNSLREEPRTILFHLENGQIAEAWLDHTL
jgi:hypothetical protein